ncbi:MAG: hypothetical protein O2782_16230 [bacterium]|nr:hypothetical protein [bacterium]
MTYMRILSSSIDTLRLRHRNSGASRTVRVIAALLLAGVMTAGPVEAQTWSQRTSNTTQNLVDVVFSTAGTAIAVGGTGNNGVITVSGDGGSTWALNGYAPPNGRDLNAVFSQAPTAVVVGNDDAGGAGGIAGVSNDYGASWSTTNTAALSNNTNNLDVVFSGASTAIAVGTGNQEVRVSNDRGATWVEAHDALGDLYAVDARGDGVVAVGIDQGGAGTPATIAFSLDRGASWADATAVVPITDADAYDVVFVSGTVVVAVGGLGRVYRSADGGDNWTNQNPSGDADNLNAVDANGLFLVAAGANGEILRSTDGGISWQLPTTGASAGIVFNDVSFLSGGIVLAVGNTGQIWGSVDYGDNWTQQISGVTTNLRRIAHNGFSNTLVVGDPDVLPQGTILLSLNQISVTTPIPFQSKWLLVGLLLAAGLLALRRYGPAR